MRPVVVYVILACGISWVIWLPLVLQSFRLSVYTLPYHHGFGAAGPLIAAYLVNLKRKTEINRLFTSTINFRGKCLWLLIAFLAPFILLLISIVATSKLENRPVELTGIGVSKEFPGMTFLVFFLYNFFSFGIGEETGWRGFMLPKIQERYNPFISSTFVTLGWAVWHIPLFFYRPGYLSMDVAGIIGWLLSLFAGSILLTWMMNYSKSILVCAIFHATIDMAFTSTIQSGSAISATGFLIMLSSVIVVIIFRKEFFAKKETKTTT